MTSTPGTGGRAKGVVLLLGAVAAATSACAYANGYDPSRYAEPTAVAAVDPEVAPLPRSPKLRMRDPRGPDIADAAAPPRARDASPAASAAAVTAAASAPKASEVDLPADAPLTCGTRADPCPMQRFMREAMETSHTPDRLVSVFTRVAGMSPDPAWSWVAIATRGADLARAGDIKAAKGQCQACHDSYREPYKALHRARKL